MFFVGSHRRAKFGCPGTGTFKGETSMRTAGFEMRTDLLLLAPTSNCSQTNTPVRDRLLSLKSRYSGRSSWVTTSSGPRWCYDSLEKLHKLLWTDVISERDVVSPFRRPLSICSDLKSTNERSKRKRPNLEDQLPNLGATLTPPGQRGG
ncbi:hypothetical protein EVAR_51385_1 [Eumeta japonica]|uniref:Uncharacterized protein n=1 Tax=Eumeta variegata TaxID=151549 RepID=A0A4C1ZV69_EUMVA|nr:hypothetical protein EVAR_51385_1 [Eumeta japonica]